MIKRPNTKAQRVRRHQRVRGKVSGTAERPRLSVFRSENNIYAQIIDDVAGKTLCSASTVEKGFEGFATRPPLTVLETRLRATTFSVNSWGSSLRLRRLSRLSLLYAISFPPPVRTSGRPRGRLLPEP